VGHPVSGACGSAVEPHSQTATCRRRDPRTERVLHVQGERQSLDAADATGLVGEAVERVDQPPDRRAARDLQRAVDDQPSPKRLGGCCDGAVPDPRAGKCREGGAEGIDVAPVGRVDEDDAVG
jgi:hypothetical protein